MRLTNRRAVAWGVCATLWLSTVAPAQTPEEYRGPKLVVMLVVDQMRADYVERFSQQWSGGLRRLVEQGAWFRQAAYPYLNTVTCTGHATIATGSFPATHGIVLNSWWDRDSGKQVSCTDDPSARAISYGPPVEERHSAARLKLANFADELRAQLGTASRRVTFSIKPRSAIMLAGHRADAVTWFDDRTGAWVTSSAYANSPVPFVAQFVKAHPVDADFGKLWNRSLPEGAYLFREATVGSTSPAGLNRTFPHVLKGASDKPDAIFYRRWAASPFSDAYLGQLAEAAVDSLGLGQGPATDFLGISFSALDSVGHALGPSSQEVQDTLIRLDGVIGALLAHLDRVVGPDNYVVAFTSDHGVAPIPEEVARLGLDAGRIVTQDVAERIEKALEPRLGPGKHVSRMVYTDLYFAPGIYGKLLADPAALQAALNAILEVPGVWQVFRSDQLVDRRFTDDRVLRAAALSYSPGRSGDLIVVPKPYWFFVEPSREVPSGPATTHGTAHLYDARVPVILMGRGIKPGQYVEPVTPADIAPTLAFLSGITLAETDGRILASALATQPLMRPAPNSRPRQ